MNHPRNVLLGLAGAVAVAAFPLFGAPPTSQPSVAKVPAGVNVVKVKLKATMTGANAPGVPGEKKTLSATLKESSPGNPPLGGKTVSFSIKGSGITGGEIHLKGGETDSHGKVTASLTLDEWPQANYKIQAAWKGDADHLPAVGEANLLMVKAITKAVLDDLVWGTYKNEPGPPMGSFRTDVKRTSDNTFLKKPLTVTVNEKTWTLGTSNFHVVPLPQGGSPWKVHVQFEGDAANAPSAADRTYVQPK